jgi:DNA-binding SARP family transcriptional activator
MATAMGDFLAAHDGTDLVPGNARSVTAIGDALRQAAAKLSDTSATLAHTSGTPDWSGPAADAFDAHRRAVLAVLDKWTNAHDAARQVLTDHQTVLAAAQDKATHALTIWRAARQQAGAAARWDNEGNAIAANAKQLQAQVRTQFAVATEHAHTLLQQARAELAEAGDRATESVREALQTLRRNRLPDLNHHIAETNSHPGTGQTVTVQPPHNGVHDTLSRIAQRTLGDARRWPQIYQLNVGHQVGPHAVLNNPNLIQPGWTLQLPATTPVPTAPILPGPITTVSPAPAAPHAVPPVVGHAAPAPPPTFHPVPPAAVHTAHGGGIDLGEGLLLGGGVVAALAGIAVATGIGQRHAIHHGTTLDNAPGPVARQLTANPVDWQTAPGLNTEPAGTDVPLCSRDGHTVLVDAAATFGLGLIGPGALAAVRAILIGTLATHTTSAAILTAQDAHRLIRSTTLPPNTTNSESSRSGNTRITIVPTRDTVLDHLETEILTRTRFLEDSNGNYTPAPLIAVTAAPDDSRRVQAIADLGVGLGIIVIILGPWPTGLTCHITTNGRINTVEGHDAPDWTAALAGLRVFTARADAARELLALLRPPPSQTPPTPRSVAKADDTLTPGQPHDLTTPKPSTDADSIARRLSPTTHAATPSKIHNRLAPATNTATRQPDSLTSTPTRPVHITVVGRLQMLYEQGAQDPVDITKHLAPKQRDIVIYLAMHPDGTRRETLAAALWPDAPNDRPYNSLHATLSQMRRAIRTATNNSVDSLIVHQDGYYTLDPSVVDVDLWHINEALHTGRHATTEHERTAAFHQIAELYDGDLADGLNADWIDTPREALRRDILDALATLIHRIRKQDPEQTLSVLEQARHLDSHNEAIYRDIMRTQARLGSHDAIKRTLDLLDTALAEIDTSPSAETRALAAELQRRSASDTATPRSPNPNPDPDHWARMSPRSPVPRAPRAETKNPGLSPTHVNNGSTAASNCRAASDNS